jgi:hypothetical protein
VRLASRRCDLVPRGWGRAAAVSCPGRATHRRPRSGELPRGAGGGRRARLPSRPHGQRRSCERRGASAADDALGALSTEPDRGAATRRIECARRPSPTNCARRDHARPTRKRDGANRLRDRRRGRDVRPRARSLLGRRAFQGGSSPTDRHGRGKTTVGICQRVPRRQPLAARRRRDRGRRDATSSCPCSCGAWPCRRASRSRRSPRVSVRLTRSGECTGMGGLLSQSTPAHESRLLRRSLAAEWHRTIDRASPADRVDRLPHELIPPAAHRTQVLEDSLRSRAGVLK